ncbi:unnamed protein product [Caenorhabditis angaria]|uniref:FBXO47 ARM repeats region domain-containing protein n=1 Tax=Caenorhabditis angaria TaxID=860376 RepID=A0A9P1MYK0_9PELO|nr:unnamed protein product [Caenorhabditis angaria]
MTRKRQNSEKITNFFPTIKKQRSNSSCENVSQQLEDCSNIRKTNENSEYSSDELAELLGLKERRRNARKLQGLTPFEKLPKVFYTQLFNSLDMRSISALSLASTETMRHVRTYVLEYAFYRRFQLDNLNFMNSSCRVEEDEDFLIKDPFYNCGSLLKSITITLSTETRAQVFLNICRNLHSVSRGTLCGFGRILEGVTSMWTFSERRVMVKAAILIDPSLHENIVEVLTNPAGKLVGLELKVRSRLQELFLNRNQEIDNSPPEEIIEFGSWLSILLQNFTEQYQGRLYYILFGPTILTQTGEKLDWSYFFEMEGEKQHRSYHVIKSRLKALLNGIRALRIMSMTRRKDMSWTSRKIYRLFLRVVDASSVDGLDWSKISVSMALAIDTSGIFCDYLIISCDSPTDGLKEQYLDVAHMVNRVRAHIYHWTGTPSTYLSEPLHRIFKHLSVIDGGRIGVVGVGGFETFAKSSGLTGPVGRRSDRPWKILDFREISSQTVTCADFRRIDDA